MMATTNRRNVSPAETRPVPLLSARTLGVLLLAVLVTLGLTACRKSESGEKGADWKGDTTVTIFEGGKDGQFKIMYQLELENTGKARAENVRITLDYGQGIPHFFEGASVGNLNPGQVHKYHMIGTITSSLTRDQLRTALEGTNIRVDWTEGDQAKSKIIKHKQGFKI